MQVRSITGIVLQLREYLKKARDLVTNERLLSTFELATSGVVSALLELVQAARAARNGVVYDVFYDVRFII